MSAWSPNNSVPKGMLGGHYRMQINLINTRSSQSPPCSVFNILLQKANRAEGRSQDFGNAGSWFSKMAQLPSSLQDAPPGLKETCVCVCARACTHAQVVALAWVIPGYTLHMFSDSCSYTKNMDIKASWKHIQKNNKEERKLLLNMMEENNNQVIRLNVQVI